MRDDLDTLNLHDLRLLSLLLDECSVTRAAMHSGQAQPAVSRRLQRLRELLSDPLLVRHGSRLVPTERGAALRAPLREILAQIAQVGAGQAFEPGQTAKRFTIACADCMPPKLLPSVIARLTSAGDRIEAFVRPIDPFYDAVAALADGGIDLLISNDPNPSEGLRATSLFTDDVVCMMSVDHPAARERRLPITRYLKLRHVVPHAATTRREGPIDGELARVGHHRRIVAGLPEFNLVPYVLVGSDLVFTTARRFAMHFAATMPLAIVRAPTEIPPMRFYQLWHERHHASPAHRWLREVVAQVCRETAEEPALSRRP